MSKFVDMCLIFLEQLHQHDQAKTVLITHFLDSEKYFTLRPRYITFMPVMFSWIKIFIFSNYLSPITYQRFQSSNLKNILNKLNKGLVIHKYVLVFAKGIYTL